MLKEFRKLGFGEKLSKEDCMNALRANYLNCFALNYGYNNNPNYNSKHTHDISNVENHTVHVNTTIATTVATEEEFVYKDYIVSVGNIGYPQAAMINHSHAPNLYHRKIGKKMIVYAKRDIKVGEELTFTYTGTEIGPETTKVWGFACNCEVCLSL